MIEKTWGWENWLVNNELYCGKILTCFQGNWSSEGLFHYHKLKDETFYILEGELLLDIAGNQIIMRQGDTIRISPNTKHRFMALTPICKIIEISTHHNDEDSYRTSL